MPSGVGVHAARQSGGRAARRDTDLLLVAGPQHPGHLGRGRRAHDSEWRHAADGQALVVGVILANRVTRADVLLTDDPDHDLDDVAHLIPSPSVGLSQRP